MSARSKARKRAVDVLYAADIRDVPISSVLTEEAKRAAREPDRVASWLYARDIVDGVVAHQVAIDAAIASHAQGWTLERMPTVDRAILRAAVWEILFNDEIPPAVAVSEAVNLARELSTDESSGFINGVLGAIASRPSR